VSIDESTSQSRPSSDTFTVPWLPIPVSLIDATTRRALNPADTSSAQSAWLDDQQVPPAP